MWIVDRIKGQKSWTFLSRNSLNLMCSIVWMDVVYGIHNFVLTADYSIHGQSSDGIEIESTVSVSRDRPSRRSRVADRWRTGDADVVNDAERVDQGCGRGGSSQGHGVSISARLILDAAITLFLADAYWISEENNSGHFRVALGGYFLSCPLAVGFVLRAVT